MTAVPPQLLEDLEHVVLRLRTTPVQRLTAPLSGPFASRVEAGRALARTLAVATQGIEDADQRAMPKWRNIPALPDRSVGDAVQVLGRDVVRVLPDAAQTVWTPSGRAPIAEVVRDVTSSVAEVARFLA